MKVYILSIIGMIFLITIADMILPEGKIGSYIKSVFAIIVLLVVVEPISKIEFKNFKFSFSENQINYQEDYLNFISEFKIKALTSDFDKFLEEKGISGAKLDIIYDYVDNVFTIKKIKINLEKAVIIDNNSHIDIKESSVQAIIDFFKVDRKDIEINGETS